jgi:amino acid adenylation domain-containing protein
MLAQPFNEFPRSALEGSIADRFREQVSLFAVEWAVKAGAVEWTYSDLDRHSNRIANRLLAEFGDGLEPVAIAAHQGVNAVAAILGVVKAGKIYVPLDFSEPDSTISAKLDNASVQGILADAVHAGRVIDFATPRCPVVGIQDAMSIGDASDPAVPRNPDDPVYIFYTSGSTGTPKGVFDSHRNVLHNILRYTNTLKIGADDRLSLIQSPSFSGTVSTLFSAVLNGASVHPMDVRADGMAALTRRVRDDRMTMFHSVPSIFERLVATGEGFPSLRVIRLEGDQAFSRHVALFQENFASPCVLVNGLGATETGLTRQYFIKPDQPNAAGAVPIGFAVPDMETMLLGPDGAEVPAGEVGEIAIRSRYLACGYWRRPDLTAQAFAPCSADPEMRIYRGGDLGRMDAHGCLTHLGRLDFRVKLRGQWVDLEVIQEAIEARSDVAAAVVTSIGGEEPGIVAYVVAGDTPGLDAPTVRQALAAEFPRHMVPHHVVFLDALPLDANGKIARKDLPPPVPVEAPAEPPSGALETTLARCWCAALGREAIGRHEDFFDLGGDSLQAIDLFLSIEKSLGRRLPRSVLLEAGTIAEMAARIDSLSPTPCLVPLQAEGHRPAVFCVHDVNGEVLNFRALAQRLGTEQPFYGIQSVGLDGDALPLLAVEDMARRYVDEMRAVQPDGPYHLAGYSMGGWIALEMAQQLRAAGQGVALLGLIDTHAEGGTRHASVGLWIRRHLKRLAALRRSDLVPYVARRFANCFELLALATRQRLFVWAVRLFGGVSARMPKWLRNPSEANVHAIRSYQARRYDGDAVLFRAEPDAWTPPDAYDGWQTLIGGTLQVRPIASQHSDILEAPQVESLATALTACLEERPG